MTTIILVITLLYAVVACIVLLFFLAKKQENACSHQPIETTTQIRYEPRPFLSPAELFFYYHLVKIVPPQISIQCKVGLWGIVKNINKTDWPKIAQKQIDFLLYDTQNNLILAAIELDDRSHEKPDAIRRDIEKNTILYEAGIPLLRFKAARNYDIEIISQQIHQSINSTKKAVPCAR